MREYLNITNECNLELMKRYEDNHFDLAIVDPPYGIGIDGGQLGYSKHEKKNWDKEHPPKEYFTELFRVSKNQIIWGFNHFLNMLEPTKAVIFWNKHQNGYFAEGELAWCSIGTVKYYDRAYQKDIGGKIIDDSGNPLPGATVVEKSNSNNGVISDFNGEFIITVTIGSI